MVENAIIGPVLYYRSLYQQVRNICTISEAGYTKNSLAIIFRRVSINKVIPMQYP